MLQQQRGLKPEQSAEASRQILERLIDQELAVQRADDLKLDRDPQVVQMLEAARREILARAYAERAGEAASKPSAEEVSKYYDDNPALFSQRRIYSIQEIAIDAAARAGAGAARAAGGGQDRCRPSWTYLKAANINFSGNQAVRAAEQLPLHDASRPSRR